MKELVHLYVKGGEVRCGWSGLRDGALYDGREIIKPGDTFAGMSYDELVGLGDGSHEIDVAKNESEDESLPSNVKVNHDGETTHVSVFVPDPVFSVALKELAEGE